MAVQSLQETPDAPRGTIEAIYGMIVTQAREPLFYRDLGVPDTVNGRFDLLLLHLWLVLRRLHAARGRRGPVAGAVRPFLRAIWTTICAKWASATSRCPKRMQAFGEAFYGRTAAYDLALSAGGEALAQALCKNILNGGELDKAPAARRLCARRRSRRLARLDEAALLGGIVEFSRRRRNRAYSHEQTERHDRQAPIPGASPSSVAQIPDTGLHRDIEADEAAREAIAELGGLREVLSAQRFARRDAEERRPLPCRGAASARGSGRPAW